MPAVSAAMLAAGCIKAYARRTDADPKFDLASLVPHADGSAPPAAAGSAAKGGTAKGGTSKAAGKAKASELRDASAEPLLSTWLVEKLLPVCAAAEATSVLCTSESSGGPLAESDVVSCRGCGMTTSRGIGATMHMGSHALSTYLTAAERLSAGTPAEFEKKLRKEAPTALRANDCGAALLATAGVHSLSETAEFRLTRVLRQRGVWQLSYSVSDGLKPLIELRITVGRLGLGRGLAALLYNLEPAMRNRLRGARTRATRTARAVTRRVVQLVTTA